MRCFLTDLRAFGINAEQWMTAAQDEEEWRRMAEQGAERIMAKWVAAEKVRAGPRHAVVCPNVTGRTKNRIAQNKRSCAGLLDVVDYIHMWRELVSSGRMSCCLSLFFFFVFFLSFFFIKAAALCSIIPRYACAPAATHSYLATACVLFCAVSFFCFLGGDDFSKFCHHCLFLLCMESALHVFLPVDVFSTL